VYFYGSKGSFAPGWYFVNRLYETVGVPFAGPFASMDDAKHAWFAHRDHQRVNKAPNDAILFAGNNTIIYEYVLILNPYHVSLGKNSRIDSFVKIEGGQGVVIGDHVHIASFSHIGIGGGVVIMDEGSSCGSGGRIMSGSNMPDAPSCSATARPEDQRQEKKITHICKNATVYAGATILPGVTVGEGARIAAGAVVLHDVEPFALYAGVPAKRMK
jgi:galactoside O-acetyltransferase